METAILKKRLNTFRGSSGRLQRVGREVVMEVLRAWESWPGNSADFYREVGLKKHQLSTLIREGKKLVKAGIVAESEFKEIAVPAAGLLPAGDSGIEIQVEGNRVLRFFVVDQVLEFLKKSGT